MPEPIRAELRPYQIEGYHFLAYLTTNRFGGVLADDMGLGKTLQALVWIAWLRAEANGKAQPSLVVCPKSVTDNWVAEAERFYPSLRVRRWTGEAADRADGRAGARPTSSSSTTRSSARSRRPSPRSPGRPRSWTRRNTSRTPTRRPPRPPARCKADYRLALTGTPIENRLLDLWSIFGFAMPGVLGNRAEFLRRFNAQDDPLARRRLGRARPPLPVAPHQGPGRQGPARPRGGGFALRDGRRAARRSTAPS